VSGAQVAAVRISANVTADFGNVTDSARSGVARYRLWSAPGFPETFTP